MPLEIESNVPLPKERGVIKPVLAQMKVGDSFLVDGVDLGSVRSTAYRYGLETKRKFVVRKSPKGPRCWRVE